MKQRIPLIPGVEFDFGGDRVYMVPPLSLGALELMQEDLAKIQKLQALDPVAVRVMVRAAHTALQRNYPDLTVEEVGELLDVGNILDVYGCVLDAAGIRRKTQEAERKNAMVTAAATTSLNGHDSSLESAPIPDGLGSTSAPM